MSRVFALALALTCQLPVDLPVLPALVGKRLCIEDDSTYYLFTAPGARFEVVGHLGDTYCLTFGDSTVTPSDVPYIARWHWVDSAAVPPLDIVVADSFSLPSWRGRYRVVGATIQYDFGAYWNPWFWVWATHSVADGTSVTTVMRRQAGGRQDSLRLVWRER